MFDVRTDASLVMQHRRAHQRRFDRCIHRLLGAGYLLHLAHHAAMPRPSAEQAGQQLLGAAEGTNWACTR